MLHAGEIHEVSQKLGELGARMANMEESGHARDETMADLQKQMHETKHALGNVQHQLNGISRQFKDGFESMKVVFESTKTDHEDRITSVEATRAAEEAARARLRGFWRMCFKVGAGLFAIGASIAGIAQFVWEVIKQAKAHP